MNSLQKKAQFYRWLTLSSYFGLLVFLFAWLLWLQPAQPEFIAISIAAFIGPLLFPLKGLLYGKPYTYAWSSYLALLYFVIGVWYSGTADTRPYGIIIALASTGFFTGAIFYARYQALHLRSLKLNQ